MLELAHVFVFTYAVFTLVLIVVWLWMPDVSKSSEAGSVGDKLRISVIVPVRNEEKNILRLLRSLEAQTLPFGYFEVIVVDDQSTDGTASLIEGFKTASAMNLRVCRPDLSEYNSSPKKRAIKTAIGVSEGEYIITTDGDCEVGSHWLETYLRAFRKTEAAFLCGPVTFFEAPSRNIWRSLWNQLQTVEFSSLIGSAACSMALRSPNMCSGANMGYQKKVFFEVGGFDGNEDLASGDDEFLMHKIARGYSGKTHYIKNRQAIVETNDQPDLEYFYRQRKRWASKWKHYDSLLPTLLAVFVFMANLSTILLLVWGSYQAVALRFLLEFVFLAMVLTFLKKNISIFFIPLTQVVYPLYVLFFGLMAQGPKTYTWKERKLK